MKGMSHCGMRSRFDVEGVKWRGAELICSATEDRDVGSRNWIVGLSYASGEAAIFRLLREETACCS